LIVPSPSCSWCNRAKRDGDDTDFRLPVRKLVRDRIPVIIRESGRIPITKQIEGEEFTSALLEKLTEEHAELLAEKKLDEIVDMIEVLLALAGRLGHPEADTLLRLHAKRRERGGFELGTFLIEIEGS